MAQSHLGTKNLDFQMASYIHKRKQDGTYIFNLKKTWEKIMLAARIITAIENPKDVCAISGRPYGQRAVLKFSVHIGATPIAGRFTPGTFTNQIQKAFVEPRLLVVTDPRVDHQPIREASYVNIPTIAICDTDSPLRYVDVAIPANNRAIHSIGLVWWFLARAVLRFRGSISAAQPWDIMVDLYFYRDPEEVEKEEAAQQATAALEAAQSFQQWDAAEAPAAATAAVDDWAAAAPAAGAAAPAAVPAATGIPAPMAGFAAPAAADEWSATPAPVGSDWGAAPTEGSWAQ